jgi:hypothetical protein
VSIPDWLLNLAAAVALLVAVLSARQLVVTRAWARRGAVDADVVLGQLLMGIALAGVLVSGLRALPNAVWAVVFAVATAWFDWRLWQASREQGAAAAISGQYAPHLLYSAAMLYLFTALAKPSPGGSGMAGMPGMPGMAAGGAPSGLPALHVPTLAFFFTLLLIAVTVRDLDRPLGTDGSPAVLKGRRVALGVTLAFLLIIMI